jgi:hypothetical protein
MGRLNLDDVFFKLTMENLEIIVEGLEMKEGDSSLAICSAGDVPFALLEFGSVLAVDYNSNQLKYAQLRKDLLVANDENFFDLGIGCYNYFLVRDYFSERLEKIRVNVKNLDFRKMNLFRAIPRGEFTKVYLSNILGYYWNRSPIEMKSKFALDLIKRMPQGGVICVVGPENFKGLEIDRLSIIPKRKMNPKSSYGLGWEYSFYRVAPKNL